MTNVLFVSTTNACRSLLAEACLNHVGNGKLRGFSCGVPAMLAEKPASWTPLSLQTAGIPAVGLHCKPWTEFTRNGALRMDFVIGLDAQDYSDLPAWPGQPVTALWDYPPIANDTKAGMAAGLAAVQTLVSLRRRIELLVNLHAYGKPFTELQHDIRDMQHL